MAKTNAARKPADMSAQPPAPARPEIAVKSLVFTQPLDLPGKPVTSSLSAPAEIQKNKGGHRITFLPWMRSHRVDYYKRGETDRPPETAYVPEHVVLKWTPVEV